MTSSTSNSNEHPVAPKAAETSLLGPGEAMRAKADQNAGLQGGFSPLGFPQGQPCQPSHAENIETMMTELKKARNVPLPEKIGELVTAGIGAALTDTSLSTDQKSFLLTHAQAADPAAFRRVAMATAQVGVFFDGLSFLPPDLDAGHVLLLRRQLMEELRLSTVADITILDSALDTLLMSRILRAEAAGALNVREKEKYLNLSATYLRNYVNLINGLRDRHKMQLPTLKLLANDNVAIQINQNSTEPPPQVPIKPPAKPVGPMPAHDFDITI